MYLQDKTGPDAYLDAVAAAYTRNNCRLWLDDGAVERKRRIAILEGLKKRNIATVECIFLLCPLYEAAERNRKRDWPIQREIFYSSWSRQEFPTKAEGFVRVRFVVTGDGGE